MIRSHYIPSCRDAMNFDVTHTSCHFYAFEGAAMISLSRCHAASTGSLLGTKHQATGHAVNLNELPSETWRLQCHVYYTGLQTVQWDAENDQAWCFGGADECHERPRNVMFAGLTASGVVHKRNLPHPKHPESSKCLVRHDPTNSKK